MSLEIDAFADIYLPLHLPLHLQRRGQESSLERQQRQQISANISNLHTELKNVLNCLGAGGEADAFADADQQIFARDSRREQMAYTSAVRSKPRQDQELR